MEIRVASAADLDVLAALDRHIIREELADSISRRRVYIAEENGVLAGWLRYNLFWDNTPFMNMLYVLEPYQGKGCGKTLVSYWENAMKLQNHKRVMTSTVSEEYAQHFYVKLGYRTVGGFLLPEDPYEIILSKEL